MSYLQNPVNHKLNHRRLIISRKRQEGVVIVVALFIVALVATMSYLMMARLARDTTRTSLILRNVQAEYYAQGSIAWAMDQLRSNWENKKNNRLVDITPITSPVSEVEGYHIKSTIYDLQSRFNINNLTTPEGQSDFDRLLQVVTPDLPEEKRRALTTAVFDWMSPTVAENAYSKFYLAQKPPYRKASRPLLSISELHLVKGMSPKIFAALKPSLVALPANTIINIQTADLPVLMLLSAKMTKEAAQSIIEYRKQKPITDVAAFLNSDLARNFNIVNEKINNISGYFLVETEVSIEREQVILYTLLERTASDKKALITPIWQSKGVW